MRRFLLLPFSRGLGSKWPHSWSFLLPLCPLEICFRRTLAVSASRDMNELFTKQRIGGRTTRASWLLIQARVGGKTKELADRRMLGEIQNMACQSLQKSLSSNSQRFSCTEPWVLIELPICNHYFFPRSFQETRSHKEGPRSTTHLLGAAQNVKNTGKRWPALSEKTCTSCFFSSCQSVMTFCMLCSLVAVLH